MTNEASSTDPSRPRSRSVSVIVVSYETRDLTCEAIASMQRHAGGSVTEFVVLDNASTDGSADAVAERFPEARVIRSEENLGFARGVNEAARHATGEYLLLLNPDTVVQDDVVAQLLDFADRRPDGGLWGGLAVDDDGTPNATSALGAPSPLTYALFGAGLSAAFRRNTVLNPEMLQCRVGDPDREVGVVTGCLLLVRRDTWEALGGFDERYFMYGEDVDLSLRARRAGLHPMISPSIVITHFVGASSRVRADKRLIVLKGKATIAREHFSPLGARVALGALAAGVGLRAAAHSAVARLRPGAGDPSWATVYRQRGEWLPGYTSAPVPAAVRPEPRPV